MLDFDRNVVFRAYGLTKGWAILREGWGARNSMTPDWCISSPLCESCAKSLINQGFTLQRAPGLDGIECSWCIREVMFMLSTKQR